MIKVYNNQPFTLRAKLSDPEPAKLVELKSLQIIDKDGKVIKSMNAEKDNDQWLTTFVFPKHANPGTYEAKWIFSFNGMPFTKTDYIDVNSNVEIETQIREIKPSDGTLPPEFEELLENYHGPV